MLDKFAEELKSAREQKGLSLQQLAQKTKLDFKFLEMMEDGDFSFLPELYVKAFLKNYARVVDLDENITVLKYEAAKAGKDYEAPEITEPVKKTSKPAERPELRKSAVKEPLKEKTVKPQTPSQSSDNKRKIIFGVLAGSVILFVVIYFIFSEKDTQIIVSEKPIDEIVEENQQRYYEEETTPAEQDFTSLSDSLHLNISASETSWVRIVYDDKVTGEFILFPLSNKTVKASDNFKITFGNSGGIKLKLNGTDLPFTARTKSVARVKIDSAGLSLINTQ